MLLQIAKVRRAIQSQGEHRIEVCVPITSDIDLVVAANVRRRRMDAGMTIKDLCAALGVSHQTIVKIERGDIRIQTDKILILSKLFSCSIDELFDGAEREYEKVSTNFIPGFRLLVRSVALIEDQQCLAALLAVTKALADASIATREASAVLAQVQGGEPGDLAPGQVEHLDPGPPLLPQPSGNPAGVVVKNKRATSVGKHKQTPER